MVALVLGLLLGVERQHGEGQGFGGVRTFPLFALAGALGALLHLWVLVSLGIGLAALLTVAYLRDSDRHPSDIGMSTEVAALIAFLLGALCLSDEVPLPMPRRVLLAAMLGTATMTLLALKRPLHGMVARISLRDVYATSRILLLAVIVLPLLPDRDLGPAGSLNPRSIGLLVVLVLGISFAGYVAIRVLGVRRGLGLTGLLGGLASSTAVTWVLARRVREAKTDGRTPGDYGTAAAIILACAVMFPRVLLELAVLSTGLASSLLWPFTVTASVAALGAAAFYRRAAAEEPANDARGGRLPRGAPARPANDESETPPHNPLTLLGAAKFGTLLSAALIITGWVSRNLPAWGTYGAALLAGAVDASAIALSMARMHQLDAMSLDVAMAAVELGVVANTIAKLAIASAVGGPKLGLRVALGLIPAIAVGTLVLVLQG